MGFGCVVLFVWVVVVVVGLFGLGFFVETVAECDAHFQKEKGGGEMGSRYTLGFCMYG